MQPSIPWSSSVSLFVIEMIAIIHSLKFTVPFSFAVPLLSLAVTHCHSLSLFVTHFHSLSLVVPLVVTRCHSLSLVVPLVVTRCHSLSLVVPLVVTRCTTRLFFYKRSEKNTYFTEHLSLADSPISVYFFRAESSRHVFQEEENEILQRNMEENSNNIVQNQEQLAVSSIASVLKTSASSCSSGKSRILNKNSSSGSREWTQNEIIDQFIYRKRMKPCIRYPVCSIKLAWYEAVLILKYH